MQQVEKRAFEARVGLHKLCQDAGLSATIITRWRKGDGTPSLRSIGKLEDQLIFEERKRAGA